ncbi:hypothetical protein OPV22_009153 [Ensete ventricosum]|uniref:Uncharacterized protein n=1 Tax=Ensete ventricosum TaxID=4639 RepID=A0AAV8R871_ENSVE|nr:hypothetical protein OPV22_009153 [Ensete ventricosum]
MMIVAEKEGIARAARGPVADCLAASPLPPLNSRHRRLHNFSFPTLSWRGQRFLRCSKLPGDATAELPGSANRDNRTSQMKSSPPRPLPGFWDSKEGERRGSQGREAEKDNYCAKAAAEATRPWNLRTRRAACNAPTDRALAMEKIKSPEAPSAAKEKGQDCSAGTRFTFPWLVVVRNNYRLVRNCSIRSWRIPKREILHPSQQFAPETGEVWSFQLCVLALFLAQILHPSQQFAPETGEVWSFQLCVGETIALPLLSSLRCCCCSSYGSRLFYHSINAKMLQNLPICV